jgi:subtilisin family serine protease
MTGNQAFASRGANIAFSKGIVVIASAGNSGATTDPYVGVPAEATNVLAIGAVRNDEVYATFSSIGPSFDGRIKPDIMAQGQASVVSNTSGTIVTANGTSFSAPIMAGMVASFWSAIPNLTAADVVQFVKESSDRFTLPTNQYGYGIPDFQLALTNALSSESFVNEVFLIYPNPVNNSIFVKIPDQAVNSVLYLYNNLGQKVQEYRITGTNQKINVENLASGMYFYELSTQNKTLQGKLLKL